MTGPGSVLGVFVLGPLVSLHQSSVDFDWINLGESSMQILKISNISDVPACYQFDIDGRGSVFSLDHPCGVLEGTATRALKVTFRPPHPISYHRRVVCLVHHQVREAKGAIGALTAQGASPVSPTRAGLSQ